MLGGPSFHPRAAQTRLAHQTSMVPGHGSRRKTTALPLSSKVLVHWCPPKPSLPCSQHGSSPPCDPKPFYPAMPTQTARSSHPPSFHNYLHVHELSCPTETPRALWIRAAQKAHSGSCGAAQLLLEGQSTHSCSCWHVGC